MSEFDVEVECPACGARFQVPRIRRGTTEPCPVCASQVAVPAAPRSEREADEDAGPSASPAGEPELGAVVAAPAPPPAAGQRRGRCFVCVEDDARFDFTKVSAIVDELDALVSLESRIKIARGMGVLAEGVPQVAAQAMLIRLAGAQVPAFAVDEGLVPPPGRELRVSRVYGVDEQALALEPDTRGRVRRVPMQALEAAFCTRQHVVPGGPTDLRVAHEVYFAGVYGRTDRRTYHAAPREREPDVECTLVLRGRAGELFSLRATDRKVRYAYLAERQTASLSQNFCAFLNDLMRLAPHAFFPGSTRAVAAGRRMQAARLQRKSDYWNYMKWVLCHVARRWHGALDAD